MIHAGGAVSRVKDAFNCYKTICFNKLVSSEASKNLSLSYNFAGNAGSSWMKPSCVPVSGRFHSEHDFAWSCICSEHEENAGYCTNPMVYIFN